MRARSLAAVLSAAVLGLPLLAAPDAMAAGAVAPTELTTQSFPDPDVYVENGTYYAYATSTGGAYFPVATASSPTGPFTVQGGTLTRPPTWAKTEGLRLWAPDVSKRPDGKYLMYFSTARQEQPLMCIATAIADSPLGPFVPDDSGPLMCPPDPLHGAIDPASFVDTDGRRYLLWKNNGNAISQPTHLYIQEVNAAGTGLLGSATRLLTNISGDGGIIEAPTLVRRPEGYTLLFSKGNYGNGTYGTGWATSTSLRGPYTRNSQLLLTTDKTDGTIQGPGGQDVVGGQIFFHGYRFEGSGRRLFSADIGWNGLNPTVRGVRKRHEAERQTLSNCQIQDSSSASDGKEVGKIDKADSWVQFKVVAPTTGSYTIRVGYQAGYGNATHQVAVNGASVGTISYADQGWSTRGEAVRDVDLTAGINTIRLTKGTNFAEIDYLDLS